MTNSLFAVITSIIATIVITIATRIYRYFRSHPQMISSVTLENTPFFKNNSKLILNKINFIYGENSTGKTALVEWISALEDGTRISRWVSREKHLPIYLTVKLSNLSPSEIGINISLSGVTYYLKDSKRVISPVGYKFVFLEKKNLKFDNYIEYISKQLSIAESQLIKLIEDFGKKPTFSTSGMKIKEEDIFIKLKGRENWQNFAVLSSGEQQRIIVEIGVFLCVAYSEANNTVLVIEESTFCIDLVYFEMLIDKLSLKQYPFQTVIVSVNKPYFKTNTKINTFVFTNDKPNIEIVQI